MSFEQIKREQCLRDLMIRFKTLGSGIINHVAEKHDFDVLKANATLMQLTGKSNAPTQHRRKARIENAHAYVSIDEIEDCIDDVLKGYRLLILLRGLPGSGKSQLAQSILKACYPNPNYKHHIHSADAFFVHNGRYAYDPRQIGEAHQWNQRNVNLRMEEGFSPIIVDNTNTQTWEMRNYLAMAVRNGYKIRVLEMNTKWCFSCNDLTLKNQHGVPKQTIKAMLERYEMGVTAKKMLERDCHVTTYQEFPMFRRCPPFPLPDHESANPDLSLPKSKKKVGDDAAVFKENNGLNGLAARLDLVDWESEIGKCVEKLDIFEPSPKVEKVTAEIGVNTSMLDFHREADFKVLYGKNREITDSRREIAENKPGMLDKGCWTGDDAQTDRNEDLKRLIDIFQNVPPTYIKDMYDDCKGDFDMTFEIFLEDNKDYSHLNLNLDVKNETAETVQSKPAENPAPSTGAVKKQPKPATSEEESKTSDSLSEDENDCDTPQSGFDSDQDSPQSSPFENYNVELNLGEFLVQQLEKQFGDPSHNFPVGFQPVVQVPKNMARQLYAFYVESMYQQMENQRSVLDELVKEDEAFARKLHEEVNGLTPKPPPEGLQEIMNEQAAMKVHLRQMPVVKTPNDLATMLTKRKLFETFPKVERDVILELYHANSLDYKQTVDDLIASGGHVGVRSDKGNIREPPISESTIQELEEAHKDSKPTKEEDNKTPGEYREEAEYYLRKRNELYQKAQEHYSRGQTEVAQFYSQLAQQQTHYYDIANNKAATVFLDENSRQLQNMNTLDLHYLFVKEAVSALDLFIDSKIDELNAAKGKNTQDLLIITGRGRRSINGVSKIRPAVIRRLETRNIRYHKMNPGLLKIKIRRNTPYTNDL